MNGPGLNITQFQGMDVSEQNPNVVIGGTQDNNAYKYDITNDSWSRFAGGDVYEFQLSELDGDSYVFSYNAGTFGVSKGSISGGSSSGVTYVPSSLQATAGPISIPQYQHPSGVIYLGQKELGILEAPCYRTKFISNVYQSNGLGSVLNAIGVCEQNPAVIFIGYGGVEQGNNANPIKVFKTVNGTVAAPVWQDITDNINNSLDPNLSDPYTIFDWIEISDIVVNPTNEEEIWISFRNISYDFSGNGTLRVIHSTNGGLTWSDWSINLPVVPVNDLEYHNGSNGGLFAATDIGIFYTDNLQYSTNGWMCINENLPVVLVNDIEINYSRNKIVAATFGRGIFEASLHQNFPYTPNTVSPFSCTNNVTVINSPIVINSDQFICGDIEINPGASLTVNATLYMGADAEIRIKNSSVNGVPGGRMFLDGGKITSSETCDDANRWAGIFVMGDPTKSQIPFSASQQGAITIRNGGTIQNAKTGIYAGKLSGFSIINTGGIVNVDGAKFINNLRDVILWPFTNYIGSNLFPVANKSNFRNVSFETRQGSFNNNLIKTQNTIHLTLLGVDGINIRKCEFANYVPVYANTYDDNNDPDVFALNEAGIGIYSINSSFYVNGYCDFYSQTNPQIPACYLYNIFKDQFYGIKAISSNPIKSASINGNFFNGCYHGIFLNGVDYSDVTRNYFQVRNVKASVSLNNSNDIPYALHLNQCSNYKITENYFAGRQPNYSQVFGSDPSLDENLKVCLQVSLPNATSEEIYNNIFKDYHSNQDINPGVGILVQGDPNDTDPSNISGLQLLCNEFYGARLTELSGPGSLERYTNHIALTQNGKVDDEQGTNFDVKSPAGNTFVNIPLQFHDNCLVNSVAYPNAEYNTTDGLINGVTYYHHPNSGAFPINIQCGSTDVVNSPVTSPNSDYLKSTACPTAIVPPNQYLFRQNILSYIKLINDEQVLIDGNNTEGLLALIFSNSSPGLVKNELMEFSPYLSDEVLITYIKSNPPHGLLRDVLEANSPLSKEVMDYVNDLIIPNGIRNQIEAVQTGISERQHLEARINWFELKKQQEINDLMRYHLQRDTVPDYLDSLKSIITQFSPNHSTCKLASAFATQKDFIQALSILDAHLADHPDDALCKLQKLMIEFDQQLSWCLNPTQDQKDKLEEIKDEPHKGCIAAKGFLELIEGLPLPDYRILPRSERSMFFEEKNEEVETTSEITLYPNPTTDYITIYSDLESEIYLIEIFDLTGRVIYDFTTVNSTNSIDLSKFATGIYSVKVSTELNGAFLFKVVKN